MMSPVVPERLHSGWYFLALAQELSGEITPLTVGRRALIAVREDERRVRVFDARCPHRGAHLGYGGRRCGDRIVCPFHGKRIALGSAKARLSVREYPTVLAGDALFFRLGAGGTDDHGFARVIREVAQRQRLVGAVVRRVTVPTDVLVENAFDVAHFGKEITLGPFGELTVEGELLANRFLARAFSPSVVVTEIGPADRASTVVTGGTPTYDGAVARVAVGTAGAGPDALDALVHGAVPGARYALKPGRQVVAFRRFCAMFPPLDG